MTLGLSVIIITRNEENDIRDCLESVKSIADEIIVLDSGSTDQTLAICRSFTDKVFQEGWKGYSAQKQRALELATGPWVLNIDADERVSELLRQEITDLLTASNPAVNFMGYRIPFHHYFLGQRLRFGGGQREFHTRLFRKDQSSYGGEKIHEGIRVEEPVGVLKSHIDHYSYRTLEDYLTKCNAYTSLIAQRKYENGDRFHFFHHFRLPYEFLVRYVFKLGFLDGGKGLMYALLSSYYVWLKYMKISDFERGEA